MILQCDRYYPRTSCQVLGMSTPSSAGQATVLTTQLIYPQYKSLIHLSNIAIRFHISHPLYLH